MDLIVANIFKNFIVINDTGVSQVTIICDVDCVPFNFYYGDSLYE